MIDTTTPTKKIRAKRKRRSVADATTHETRTGKLRAKKSVTREKLQEIRKATWLGRIGLVVAATSVVGWMVLFLSSSAILVGGEMENDDWERIEAYGKWLRNNQDKAGSEDFVKVSTALGWVQSHARQGHLTCRYFTGTGLIEQSFWYEKSGLMGRAACPRLVKL